MLRLLSHLLTGVRDIARGRFTRLTPQTYPIQFEKYNAMFRSVLFERRHVGSRKKVLAEGGLQVTT